MLWIEFNQNLPTGRPHPAVRVTLARSVISSIPLYPMQSTKLPISICKEIEKLQRSFIWGHNSDKRNCHLIDWDTICLPKNYGGLLVFEIYP